MRDDRAHRAIAREGCDGVAVEIGAPRAGASSPTQRSLHQIDQYIRERRPPLGEVPDEWRVVAAAARLTMSGIAAADDASGVINWTTPARSFPEEMRRDVIATRLGVDEATNDRSATASPGTRVHTPGRAAASRDEIERALPVDGEPPKKGMSISVAPSRTTDRTERG